MNSHLQTPHPPDRARRRPTPRGFTLVELMVAVVLAGLVIALLYAMLTITSRTVQVQEDASQTIDRAYFALDLIKSDLRRAGYLGVPSAELPTGAYRSFATSCTPSPTGDPLYAMEVLEGGSDTVNEGSGEIDLTRISSVALPYNTGMGRQPDRLLLFGAYRTMGIFRPDLFTPGSTSVVIDSGLDSDGDGARFEGYLPRTYTGDPVVDADVAELTEQQFTRMWAGSLVALATPAGGMQFLRVADNAVTWNLGVAPAITLQDPVQTQPDALAGGPGTPTCSFRGFGNAMFTITPMHYVAYTVIDDPEDPNSRDTLLVREELGWDMTVLDRVVVARNVIDFQVWVDGAALSAVVPPQPSVLRRDGDIAGASQDWTDDIGALDRTDIEGATATPGRARYAHIQLTLRLDQEQIGLAQGSGADLPRLVYNSEGDIDSGSRMITIRGQTVMPQFVISQLNQ